MQDFYLSTFNKESTKIFSWEFQATIYQDNITVVV